MLFKYFGYSIGGYSIGSFVFIGKWQRRQNFIAEESKVAHASYPLGAAY